MNKTTLKIGRELVKPNLYWIPVAPPGTGKTAAFVELIQKPIAKMSERSKPPTTFLVESFTYVGLLQNLSDANGHLMIGADEIIQQLEADIQGMPCVPFLWDKPIQVKFNSRQKWT
jgi:hypothetical protein